jgi:bacillithiol biosynthesis cysteine-adding enzyme BshC
VASTYGVPAVPVFWVEAEDHDWPEVRAARALDRDAALYDAIAADPPGAGRQPIGRLAFEPGIEATLMQFVERLPPTEFTNDILAGLRRRYQPGAGIAAAFAGWMDDLFGRHGLVVFQADDAAMKPLVADIFAGELQSPRTAALAREGGAALAAAGHNPQVEPAPDAIALFYIDGSGRQAIRRHDVSYQIGDRTVPAAELVREATDHPERFSPNVLLRPVVQDRMFPTVCYVAGPSELAYQAQIGGVYRAFNVEPPLLKSRVSATLLDSGAVKFFDRSGLPLEALQPQDERALNDLLARELPPDLERKIAALQASVTDGVNALRGDVTAVDSTLGGAIDTTMSRMQETVQTLHAKVIQAAKRKDDTLRRQFARTRALTFPGGDPQERALCAAYFLNRYGPALPDRLLDILPLDTSRHYVIAL